MNDKTQEFDRYFRSTVGESWQALLAPVPGAAEEGIRAEEDDSFRRIRHERHEEDATLPLGAWERELKRADWNAASELAAKALVLRSKDLQLAAWLFEALIPRTGFQSLAPCLSLIEALFVRYGAHLHPKDKDHRVNLLHWIGQKLLPVLRRVPITATGGDRDYAWNDWEQAQRNEQLRATLGKQRESEIEGATLADVGAALSCTPHQRVAFLQACLAEGLASLQSLEEVLDLQLGEDAPGFNPLRTMLERIEVVLAAEARRRGIAAPARADEMQNHGENEAEYVSEHISEVNAGSQDRREVYAALSEIARALESIEPHSPVPYLIRRAVEWGGLNTAQLYNEVFVRCGGQINIFELLGLGDPVAGHERQAAG